MASYGFTFPTVAVGPIDNSPAVADVPEPALVKKAAEVAAKTGWRSSATPFPVLGCWEPLHNGDRRLSGAVVAAIAADAMTTFLAVVDHRPVLRTVAAREVIEPACTDGVGRRDVKRHAALDGLRGVNPQKCSGSASFRALRPLCCRSRETRRPEGGRRALRFNRRA
jgi:hypothetical protein